MPHAGETAYGVVPARAGRGLYQNLGTEPLAQHTRRVESWLRGIGDAVACATGARAVAGQASRCCCKGRALPPHPRPLDPPQWPKPGRVAAPQAA